MAIPNRSREKKTNSNSRSRHASSCSPLSVYTSWDSVHPLNHFHTKKKTQSVQRIIQVLVKGDR